MFIFILKTGTFRIANDAFCLLWNATWKPSMVEREELLCKKRNFQSVSVYASDEAKEGTKIFAKKEFNLNVKKLH